MVKCRRCGTNDNLIKNKFKKFGLESLCKDCSKVKSDNDKEVYKIWYENNRERLIKLNIDNREKRRTKPKRVLLTAEEKEIRRKESIRKKREKRKSNKLFCIYDSVSNLLRTSIKKAGYKKRDRCEKIIGCTIEEFKNYIENRFIDNMNWENYGEWHFDHIIPISWARSEDEVYKLSLYKNLQPLWSNINLSKGNILNRKECNLDIDNINKLCEQLGIKNLLIK